jgi:hypothetical protein
MTIPGTILGSRRMKAPWSTLCDSENGGFATAVNGPHSIINNRSEGPTCSEDSTLNIWNLPDLGR